MRGERSLLMLEFVCRATLSSLFLASIFVFNCLVRLLLGRGLQTKTTLDATIPRVVKCLFSGNP